MKDNRGFSLVELIIVIAIMAVMGTFVLLGFSLLTGQNARECANDISTALSKEKNYALARSATIDCYMELLYDDSNNGYYVRYYQPRNAVVTGRNNGGSIKGDDWVLAEEQKVGKGSVDIICNLCDGDGNPVESVAVDGGYSVKFVYDRISGAIKGVVKGDSSTPGIDIVSGTVKFCDKITISSGRTYEIDIHSATGKHELTRVD